MSKEAYHAPLLTTSTEAGAEHGIVRMQDTQTIYKVSLSGFGVFGNQIRRVTQPDRDLIREHYLAFLQKDHKIAERIFGMYYHPTEFYPADDDFPFYVLSQADLGASVLPSLRRNAESRRRIGPDHQDALRQMVVASMQMLIECGSLPDLKLNNIIANPDTHPKLIDVGCPTMLTYLRKNGTMLGRDLATKYQMFHVRNLTNMCLFLDNPKGHMKEIWVDNLESTDFTNPQTREYQAIVRVLTQGHMRDAELRLAMHKLAQSLTFGAVKGTATGKSYPRYDGPTQPA